MIKKLLDAFCKGTKQKLFEFNQYVHLYEKKTDIIILELKKESFLLSAENDDEESESKEEVE